MRLSIIIPAYNEEKAIGRIVERTLDARGAIMKDAGVSSVEIIVVNDGSTDATGRIARGYDNITLISYTRNKGYGAAIKQGFGKADGDVLGFLDADGTCDPLLFVKLVDRLKSSGADIVIGSRLGAGSRMPPVRRLGNVIYAAIINFFANTHISDCSSGMRVLRKSALKKLYPLPDGLDFTPAMTCRALFGGALKVSETPIKYAERTGKSKLSVIADGVRFLKTILGLALRYKRAKSFIVFLLAVWAVLWAVLGMREMFMKHNLEDYKILLQRPLDGKRAYTTGDRFYEFIKFCNSNLPQDASYAWAGGDKESLSRRRATYYLYPHKEDERAQFLLVCDDAGAPKAGYDMFAELDKDRYILKISERRLNWK